MTLLEDLYYGNLTPCDICFDRESNFARYAKLASENEEKLTALLNALPDAVQAREWLAQMSDAQQRMNGFAEAEKFIEGFRMGAGIMLETFIAPQQSVIRDID